MVLEIEVPTPVGVGVIDGNQSMSSECYVAELQQMRQLEMGRGIPEQPCPNKAET